MQETTAFIHSIPVDPLTGAEVAAIVRRTIETPGDVIAKVQAAMIVKDAGRAPGAAAKGEAE